MLFDPDHSPIVHQLRDGTPVRLRMIGPGDRDRLAAGFEKLSRESRYRRFFTAMPELTPKMLEQLTATDGSNHVAIGAEVASDDPAEAEGLGVARFFRLADRPDTAEVAIAVIDERQGLGLGHLLLRALVHTARERGIRRFSATVLHENARARGLLEDMAEHPTVRDDGDSLVYEMELPEAGDDDLTRGPLYRFLKLAAGGLQFVFRQLGFTE